MGALDLEIRDDQGMSEPRVTCGTSFTCIRAVEMHAGASFRHLLRSPLLSACCAGSLAGVKWLLQHSADCYAEAFGSKRAAEEAVSRTISSATRSTSLPRRAPTQARGLDEAIFKRGQVVRCLCRWDADVSRPGIIYELSFELNLGWNHFYIDDLRF